MNGDGLKDLLIPRADQKNKTGALYWFEQPVSGALDDIEWTEHKIADGPDLFSAVEDIGSNEILLWAS